MRPCTWETPKDYYSTQKAETGSPVLRMLKEEA
jgi:hypothetical protein